MQVYCYTVYCWYTVCLLLYCYTQHELECKILAKIPVLVARSHLEEKYEFSMLSNRAKFD